MKTRIYKPFYLISVSVFILFETRVGAAQAPQADVPDTHATLVLAAANAGSIPHGFPAADITVIKVYFKLDPRLTQSLYMGDRWVSPPTFTYANPPEGKAFAVEVRAYGLSERGGPIDISPEWTSTDADRLQVAPIQGQQVKFTVLQEGPSRVTVSYGGLTKELHVEATHDSRGTRLEISQ